VESDQAHATPLNLVLLPENWAPVPPWFRTSSLLQQEDNGQCLSTSKRQKDAVACTSRLTAARFGAS